MCGIVGIFSQSSVSLDLCDALIHLQHRGTDAAGILTYDSRFHTRKGMGLARDVFNETSLKSLTGNWGIANNRYTTTGSSKKIFNVQPFVTNSPYGISLVHNGNIINPQALRKELEEQSKYYCNSESDTEIILGLLASELHKNSGSSDFFEELCKSVGTVFDKARGGYSIIGIIAGKGMFAFRDPNGIRPFVWGKRENDNGQDDFIFSSENTMYHPLNFKLQGNVLPGEVIFVDKKGEMHRKRLRKDIFTPCAFEYVYLARPDALINNISVYRARLRMGENLAKKWKRFYPDVTPDIVIPVPFCANSMALSMAHVLGVRYSEGLYKNPFVGRTFIMPGQKKRRKSVLQKLSPQELEIKGKNVMLVDDSIVRGTTSKEVVKLVRDSGAKKVYFVSAAPPIKYPDFYGIDISTQQELIAANKSVEEIRQYMDVDVLLYQDIKDLAEAITRKGDHNIDRLSMPYFDGWYVAGKPNKFEEKKEIKDKKILIVGSGAREHAILRALLRSKQKTSIYCFGTSTNPGIKKFCIAYEVGKIDDTEQILTFAKNNKIDFAIIGPEAPLQAGLADLFWENNIPTVGPTKKLAQLETSKSFTRKLMEKYEISGMPKYKIFNSTNGVEDFLNELGGNYVIKADGLMCGKGVKVSGEHLKNFEEALEYCHELLSLGNSFVIEEKFIGQEFSLMSFSDGKNLVHMPAVQDHKRAFENDEGPNTGGMGSYSCSNHSLPFLNEKNIQKAKGITRSILNALSKEFSEAYKGILYGGFMLTKDGVKVIEYNARFGDPESLNVLSILESDFVEICEGIIKGKLDKCVINFAKKATVCKYAVPLGYPVNPIKGEKIDISWVKNQDNLYLASVDVIGNDLIETGSRTVAFVGVADKIYDAEIEAETEIQRIKGPLFHRKDIGKDIS